MQLFDPYGSLTTAVVAMQMHRDMSRKSGRTNLMIASALETGGTIICTLACRPHIESLVRACGTKRTREVLRVTPVDPKKPGDIQRNIRQGPLYFDHEWLYEYHLDSILAESDALRGLIERYPSPLHHYSERAHNMGLTHGIDMVGSVYKDKLWQP